MPSPKKAKPAPTPATGPTLTAREWGIVKQALVTKASVLHNQIQANPGQHQLGYVAEAQEVQNIIAQLD